MATTDVTNTLTATITSTEQSTSNVDINRNTGNPAFLANVGQFTTYYALQSGANPIPLPATGFQISQVYIKNIDSTKSISVAWAPDTTGTLVTVCTLNPGDQIMLWANSTAAVTPGITQLTLTPSAIGCLVEYFLGG